MTLAMLGVDEWLASLGAADALAAALAVAVLLGLRHATDPDHLTAVTTLVATEGGGGSRRAGALGLTWGLGHATTLLAFGLPIVLFKSQLPAPAQTAAEVTVGVIVMALAARLLVCWRRRHLHVHPHRHGRVEHRHLHVHGHRPAGRHPHGHEHTVLAGRSPRQAYAVGLVHGIGGSAGIGVLLLASLPSHAVAVAALLLFALGSAVSMAAVSSGFGLALSRPPVRRRMGAIAPALGAAGMTLGAWYALGALEAVPYVL